METLRALYGEEDPDVFYYAQRLPPPDWTPQKQRLAIVEAAQEEIRQNTGVRLCLRDDDVITAAARRPWGWVFGHGATPLQAIADLVRYLIMDHQC